MNYLITQVNLFAKRNLLIYFAFLISFTIATTAKAADVNGYWDYNHPEKWGEVAKACNGKMQSPIDLSPASKLLTKGENLKINYNNLKPTTIVNDGHSIQINFNKGSTLVYDNKVYNLVQMHFHTPGEHKIGRKRYTMEIHFVHQSKDGSLAVLGILFKKGKVNPVIESIINQTPVEVNKPTKFNNKLANLKDLIPNTKKYYTYKGSLTVPPCTENVRWVVLENNLNASREQVLAIKNILKGDTERPLQPKNNRTVNIISETK